MEFNIQEETHSTAKTVSSVHLALCVLPSAAEMQLALAQSSFLAVLLGSLMHGRRRRAQCLPGKIVTFPDSFFRSQRCRFLSETEFICFGHDILSLFANEAATNFP